MCPDYAALIADVEHSSAPSGCRDGFSDEQAQVLELPSNASLVLRAGAGSGKTRVLVERAARLVESGVAPSRIALVSFTRKSAQELTRRLLGRLRSERRLPTSATLHALALRFATQGGGVSLRPELAYEVLPQLRRELGNPPEVTDQELLTTLGRFREALRTDGTFGLAAMRLRELLAESGGLDFTSALELASPRPEQRFSHLLIDEAQDLSPLQQGFVERALAPRGHAWFVGDDDQAIFAFRGAGGTLLQQMAARVEHVRTLAINWRCPPGVVEAANRLMRHASDRDPVQWVAGTEGAGTVTWLPCDTVGDEVRHAAHALRCGRLNMVLGRTNRGLEPFAAAGLPVSTVHEAKGCEWPYVWLQGMGAGRFPLPHADMNEERRLCYVALTRAKAAVTVSWSGTPSPFIAQSH